MIRYLTLLAILVQPLLGQGLLLNPFVLGEAVSGNGLLTSLEAYYKMDEALATDSAEDAHGAKDLTDTGDPAVTTGILNGARTFTSGGARFASTTESDFDITGDCTITGWFKTSDNTGTQGIIGKSDFGNNQRSFYIFKASGNASIRAHFSDLGTDEDVVDSGVIPTVGTWYFFAWRKEGTATKLQVVASGGSLPAGVTGTTGTNIFNSSTQFSLGHQFNNGTATQNFRGQIDEVAVWSRALTDDQVALMFALTPYADFE